jgi:NAD-specific glutamate dehydrogenase
MINAWQAANQALVDRALSVLADVKSSGTFDTTTLPVVLRELKDLSREDLS